MGPKKTAKNHRFAVLPMIFPIGMTFGGILTIRSPDINGDRRPKLLLKTRPWIIFFRPWILISYDFYIWLCLKIGDTQYLSNSHGENGKNWENGENGDNPLECGVPYFQTRPYGCVSNLGILKSSSRHG